MLLLRSAFSRLMKVGELGVCLFLATVGVDSLMDPEMVLAAQGNPQQSVQQSPWSIPANLMNKTPPEFQAGQVKQMANVFTSCAGYSVPMDNLMNTMLTGTSLATGGQKGMASTALMAGACGMASGISVSTDCPGSDNMSGISQMGQMSCDTYNPSFGSQMLAQLQNALCANACKRGKISAIQGELQCLTQQASLLQQQAGSLNQVYEQAIQQMQTTVQNFRSTEQDFQDKISDIELKLNGNPASGTQGILKLEEQTQALLNAMPAQVQAQRAHLQKVQQLQKSLAQQMRAEKASYMMKCFQETPVASYKCEPNGPPQSPKDYLLCRFRQTQLLDKNGIVDRYAATNQKADSQASSLQAVLDQISGYVPRNPNAATTPEEVIANSKQPTLVFTAQDVAGRYGPLLRRYSIGNVNAADFVNQVLQGCESTAGAIVQSEESRVDTPIGQAEFNIQNEQQNLQQENVTLLNAYNEQYTADVSGLAGQNASFNTAGCMNSPLSTQINCLQNFQKAMQGLLFGTGQGSMIRMKIHGSNAATTTVLACQGLHGCATALQGADRELVANRKILGENEKKYELAAFQQAQTFTKNLAKQMDGPSQFLHQQIQSINVALASLGQSGVHFPPVRGEPLQKDPETGLPVVPDNAFKTIGMYVNPPLLDLNNSGQSLNGMGAARQQIEQNNMMIMQKMTELQNMPNACALQRNTQIIDQVMNAANNAGGGPCYIQRFCHPPDKQDETLRNMRNALHSIMGAPGAYSVSFDTLATGVETFCEEPVIGDHAANDLARNTAYQNERACAAFHASLLNAKNRVQPGHSQLGGRFGMGAAGIAR